MSQISTTHTITIHSPRHDSNSYELVVEYTTVGNDVRLGCFIQGHREKMRGIHMTPQDLKYIGELLQALGDFYIYAWPKPGNT